MSDERERRRQRRESYLQVVAFVGAAVVLGIVLFAAFAAQADRRDAERAQQTMDALLAPTPLPTGRGVVDQPSVPTVGVPYPGPAEEGAEPVPTRGFPSPLGPRSTPLLSQRPAVSWIFPHISDSLDPARFGRPTPALQALFLGLTTWSRDGQTLLPLLAEEWTISPDGLVYTFRLRQDVSWIRCDPESWEVEGQRLVTADDVLYTLERSLDPGFRAPYASMLYPIVGAEERHGGDAQAPLGIAVLDPFTVRFTLTRPMPDFPGRLADPVAWPVPREVVENHGGAWTEPGTIWVNGGFCPVIWVPTRVVTGVGNPWRPDPVWEVLEELLGPWLQPLVPPVPTPPSSSYPSP